MHSTIELKDEERTRCEVWTRVMGYHRPISAFNPGKQAEQAERICFNLKKSVAQTHDYQNLPRQDQSSRCQA